MAVTPSSPTTSVTGPHVFLAAGHPDHGSLLVFASEEGSASSRWIAGWQATRILIRPEPGFYVMRLRSGAPLVAAIIYQLCPMVMPEPASVRARIPTIGVDHSTDRPATRRASMAGASTSTECGRRARCDRLAARNLNSAVGRCAAGPDKIPARPKRSRTDKSILMPFPPCSRR